MDLHKEYTEETGKQVYIDILGVACMTIEYVEWLEREITKARQILSSPVSCDAELSDTCPLCNKFV